uniref:Uncharacterized protein n=1 Tax=Chromera velia CCMP2878 TaxID=1169474 RepID=A0A0G4HE36_9ALVE|eukprot:Cvel_960.t1-p1 / transcript=Cvel_960.t1 / gene=Cvel_960 / organism=Chromera_velia_CCMP2878 / gene_product=hypothetical protein / transcript_product=hypothetical protein / location=Cvel_scaffold31:25822-27369(-) / protein_length=378 / sequence_SO=supercontig / SO=protein_coding / is_pseudo=false
MSAAAEASTRTWPPGAPGSSVQMPPPHSAYLAAGGGPVSSVQLLPSPSAYLGAGGGPLSPVTAHPGILLQLQPQSLVGFGPPLGRPLPPPFGKRPLPERSMRAVKQSASKTEDPIQKQERPQRSFLSPGLPTGEWVSPSFPTENTTFEDTALVVWNFDITMWDFDRICNWITSVEVLLRDRFGLKAHFFAAMKQRCIFRRHFHALTGGEERGNSRALADLWGGRPSKLVVLPQTEDKSGATSFLYETALSALLAPPDRRYKALLFPTQQNVFAKNPELQTKAKEAGVTTILMTWTSRSLDMEKFCTDHIFVVDKMTGLPVSKAEENQPRNPSSLLRSASAVFPDDAADAKVKKGPRLDGGDSGEAVESEGSRVKREED